MRSQRSRQIGKWAFLTKCVVSYRSRRCPLNQQYERKNSPSMKLCTVAYPCNHISAGFRSSALSSSSSSSSWVLHGFIILKPSKGSLCCRIGASAPAPPTPTPKAFLLSDIALDRRSGTDPVRLVNMQHNWISENKKSMLPCSIWDTVSEHVANMH